MVFEKVNKSHTYFIKKSQQLYSVFPLLPNLLQLRRRQNHLRMGTLGIDRLLCQQAAGFAVIQSRSGNFSGSINPQDPQNAHLLLL